MGRSSVAWVILALVSVAILPAGSDGTVASLIFSSVLAIFAAAHIVLSRAPIGGFSLAGFAGAIALFIVAVSQGWVSSGADEYSALVVAFGVFAVAQTAGRDSRLVERLWGATIAAGLVLAALASADFFADRLNPSPLGRLDFPLASANNTATLFGVVALMALTSILKAIKSAELGLSVRSFEKIAKRAWLSLATLVICVVCVFLTASRAGGSLLLLAVLALIIWEGRRGFGGRQGVTFRSGAISVGLVAIVGVLFLAAGDLYSDRLSLVFDQPDTRSPLFTAYASALSLAPIVGHGLGGFVYVNALVADAQNAEALMAVGAAHNVLLQWGLEGGFVGVAFIVAIGAAWLWIMRRGLHRRNRQTRYIRGSIIMAFFVAAHGMVDYALQIQGFTWLFAWVCGLGAGVATGGSVTRAPFGPLVSRAITPIVAAILLATSLLSGMAFLDRYGADEISRMDDATFMARFEEREDLRGSSYRLAQIGGRALRLEAPDGELARRALQASVAVEPRDGSVWFSYAIAVALDEGAFNEEALSHLERSYALMPYGRRDFARARVDFIELTWAYVSNPIREAAIREARIFSSPGQLERLERHYALQSIDG